MEIPAWMVRQRQELVAETFGAEPELLPLLPALLADLEALGSSPEKVVTILGESAELPQRAAVVDLGCGKGAISIAIARELGYQVRGVDLFEPFLKEAVAGARAASVDHLCSFEVADIRDVVQELDLFDATVFAGVGAGLYGDYSDCIGAIRLCTRPDGYIVISDCFLKQSIPPNTKFKGYEYYQPHDEMVRQLTAHGDAMVREILVSSEEFTQQNLHDLGSIRKRVQGLSGTQPQYRDQLKKFLRSQEAEYDFLNNATTEAIWLLRRTGIAGAA